MIPAPLWQEQAIADLRRLLEPDVGVCALLVHGSCANAVIQLDVWSDVDITLIVADGDLDRFFPSTSWLAPLGEIYTTNQSSKDFSWTTRVCFSDFRRVDCRIVREADFAEHIIHGEAIRVLFSRSPIVDARLTDSHHMRPPGIMVTDEELADLSNAFWFKGMLATTKVMRNDLLIAAHLALEMIQDTCVLEMWLRDRALGTTHHREGGWGNAFVADLWARHHLATARDILECVKHSSVLFDDLAAQWSPTYQEHRHPLLAWIRSAQEAISGVAR